MSLSGTRDKASPCSLPPVLGCHVAMLPCVHWVTEREAEMEVEQKGYSSGKTISEALRVGYQSTPKAQEAAACPAGLLESQSRPSGLGRG